MKYFGHRVRVLHWCTSGLLNDAVSQYGLTASQGRILGFIAHQPTPPCAKDIEEFFNLSHPSISGVLKRLEQKKFISFQCDEDDHRCRRIYLLPKGQECHERIGRKIDEIETRMVQNLSPEEQEIFYKCLNQAILNLGVNPTHPIKEDITDD